MYRIVLIIFILSAWFYLLLLFRNLKMNFFRFLAGSIGIFTISMIFFMGFLEKNLDFIVSDTLNHIGAITGYFQVFAQNSIVSVNTRDGIVSILINYECSGIIEMMVFTSLGLFFPFGGVLRRLLSVVIGNIYIFGANILRVIFIVFLTKTFGVSIFYLAHTLFARILFFGLMILLYYYVFTTTHLKYQNVGEIR